MPSSVIATLENALQELGEPAQSMIDTVSAAHPSAAAVLSLAGRLEPARHSEDAAFDVRFATIAARRLLDSAEARDSSNVAAFAIEILADQGITQGFEIQGERQLSPTLPTSIEEPGEIARELSRSGISINLLGLAESNRLVRVTAEAGELRDVIYEPEGVFSKKSFESWSRQYPHRYGFETYDANVFYTTMNGLGISSLPVARTLLVMDTALQQLPPNLLMASDDFIGRSVPVAAAPSITWLKNASARPRRAGQATAWIPLTKAPQADQTLAIVADRLSGALQKHGVSLNTNTALPETLSGSELAIIAAHGGIIPEGRFFQVVADDADMRITAGTLSAAVRNAGVAVLFVCSAGRFDKHPMASTTTGLAKEILDGGASVVIASPWPLHSSVPAYWLPTFLDKWSAGHAVIDANFEANKAVARALGDSPAYCLAMTVFGDPLLTKSTSTWSANTLTQPEGSSAE